MKILYVDQFGKTAGRDTLAQAKCVSRNDSMNMTVYLSDNTEIPQNSDYRFTIKKGFHGAYEGNFIHKTVCYMRALIELKKYIKQENFDIVHLQWFSLPWIEWIYVKRLRKICKVVITVHDVIPFNNRPMEMKSLDKIYSQADRLLLHTESSLVEFQRNYRAKTPISIITQGFCLKSDYKKIDKTEARMHFNIPEHSVVFLYYGTIRASKGLDLLIRAIGKAHESEKNVYLLAGGAFQKIDPAEYLKLVQENLEPSFSTINFNFIPMTEEPYYFSAADVLCLPYREITQSGVAQVGLMYDLPLISSNIGEMSEVAKQDINGELIEAGNIEQLEAAILKLARNEKLREKYSSASKDLGKNEFSVEIKAERVVQAYKLVTN